MRPTLGADSVRFCSAGRGTLRTSAFMLTTAFILASSLSRHAVLITGSLTAFLVALCVRLAARDTRPRAW